MPSHVLTPATSNAQAIAFTVERVGSPTFTLAGTHVRAFVRPVLTTEVDVRPQTEQEVSAT